MLIYVICFGISIIYAFMAERAFKDNLKKKGIMFSIISILVLSLLAAFRGMKVGKDTAGYISIVFSYAVHSPTFINYWNDASMVEIGYRILCYLVSLFTNNLSVLFFISELLIIVPIYISFYEMRNKLSIGIGMMCFCFLFFSHSLSMVRQAIAISFLIYSFISFIEKKYKKTILLFIIATTFHNSAFLFGILYIIMYCGGYKINNKESLFIFSLYLIIVFFMIMYYENIIKFLAYNVSIISVKYAEYFKSSNYNLNISNFLLLDTTFCLFLIFSLLVYLSKRKEKIEEETIYIYMFTIDLVTIFISSKMSLAFRFGLNFGIPAKLLFLPQLDNIIKKEKYNKIIEMVLFIVILGGYWFYTEIVRNGYGINPYVLTINKFV